MKIAPSRRQFHRCRRGAERRTVRACMYVYARPSMGGDRYGFLADGQVCI